MFWIGGLIFPVAIIWFFGRLFFRRNQAFPKQLSALMDLCAAEGIVSEDQREKILARSQSMRQGIQLRGTTWIAIMAGLFVAAGVSLIVAHNWDQVPPVVRILSFLFFLAALGETAIRLEARGVPWSLPFSILWFILPVLGIGLYAQTFQLSGDPIRPFIVWMLLTSPLAWLSQKKVLPILHLGLIVGVLYGASFTRDNAFALVGSRFEPVHFSAWAWIFAIAMMGLAFVESFKLLAVNQRKHVFGAALLWVTLLVFAPTSLKIEDESWLFAAATSASTLWLALHLLFRSSPQERVPSYVSIAGCAYAMTFLWHGGTSSTGEVSPYGLLLVCGMAAAAAATLLVFSKERFSHEPGWHRLFQVLLTCPLVFSFFMPFVGEIGTKAIAILANLLLFAGALGAMWHGAYFGSNLQINLGVGVLLLVLVTRFFDVLGNFIQGGIGFIVSGIFLGLVAYALGRTRRHLLNRSGAGGSR